jgi:competence protein ComEA
MAIKDKLPHERFGLVILSALVVAGGTYAVVKGQRQPAPIVFSSQSSSQSQPPAEQKAPEQVVVHVTGAVKQPGIVRLSIGSRVEDAVKAAGGAKADADIESINLAAKLLDGTQLFVPTKIPASRSTSTHAAVPKLRREVAINKGPKGPIFEAYGGGTVIAPYKVEFVPDPQLSKGKETAMRNRSAKKELPTSSVNLNSATLEQLQTLPGVGPSTAQKIVDYRKEHGSFSSVDELQAVKGIGPKKMEAMRKYLQI